jgi:hypothetical protein
MSRDRAPQNGQPPRVKAWDGSGAVCVTFQADAGADAAISRCARCGCAEWLHRRAKTEGTCTP